MPRKPLHAVVWSPDRQIYELYTHGQLELYFRQNDEAAWLAWLADQTSVVFQGRSNRLNLHKEARPRGERYWYAYHTASGHTTKRYLGATENLTFSRLEQESVNLADATLVRPSYMREKGKDADASDVLLRAKLAPPTVPSLAVPRERLLNALETGLKHRLILIAAAAGWGKTTLLSTWANAHRGQVAWVSLDELDNNLARFWEVVISALRMCLPSIGNVALAMLRSVQPPSVTTILTTLLNELAGGTGVKPAAPILLILDDYHLIDDPAIHETLTFLIEHIPEHMHLAIASRVDPDLPLARLRVQGQLAEIRADDLRFNNAEAAQFFTQTIGPDLTETVVQTLELRTGGWIAGLQLAALALRQQEDLSIFAQAFSGSHRYLMDYVQQEILRRQPLRVQHFLLRISILPRMNAALCAVLTDEQFSQQMLELLERHNLFIVPLDDRREWYRLHDLFREILLAQLHTSDPQLEVRLHQQAAKWYAEKNEMQEAISHAMAASDFAYAATLIEQTAEAAWLKGQTTSLFHWIMELPDAEIRIHAPLVLTVALYLLNATALSITVQQMKTRAQVDQLMARVEASVGKNPSDAAPGASEEEKFPVKLDKKLLDQRLRLLRGWCEAFDVTSKGDVEGMERIWQQMQNLEIEDEVVWQMIPLSVAVVLRVTLQHQGASVLPLLQDARPRIRQAANHFATIKIMQWLAMSYLQAGQLRDVHQECITALDIIQRIEGHTILAGYFHIFIAEVCYQWNDLESAQASLRQAQSAAQTWQQVDLQIAGYRLLVNIELALRNLDYAEQTMQAMEQFARDHGFPIHLDWSAGSRVRLWLAQSDMESASEWASQVIPRLEARNPSRTQELLELTRVFLARGQFARALDILQRFSEYLDRAGDIDTTIRFLAFYSITLHLCGETTKTFSAAARLLKLSEPGGYLRLYLDLGEPMRKLLQAILRNRDQLVSSELVPYISRLLACFEQERDQAYWGGQSRQTATPTATSALPGPIVALTLREREVLQLLLDGASNHEIAAKLVISLPTVKKHVSNVLGKLGVDTRTQLIARAREWYPLL